MAGQLIADMTTTWQPDAYHDTFEAAVNALVQRKVGAGKTERVTPLEDAPEAEARSNVVDLTELLAKSLAGTPPALVLTVAHDPLCDEGVAYARRLEDDGVRVTALHLSDHMHGMLMHGKLVQAGNVMLDFVGAAIGDALHRGVPAGQA